MTLSTLNWTELSLQAVITFAHFLWQACLIAALLMVIDRWLLARQLGRSAKLRYLVACIAFFALPTSVAATYAMVHHARGPIVLASSARNAEITPANARTTETSLSFTVPQDDLAVDQGSVNQAIQTAHPVDASRSSNALESSSDWSQPLQAASPYLLMAYACGVICLLARFGVSIIGSSRLRTMVEPITDTQLARIVTEQSARLQLKRIPVVALCQRVSVPVVVGIIKPMILLPTSLYLGLDPSQLAAVLSHEMAHIRRYDLIVNLLQRIVEALLFFHPVTWWISRRVSMERENCCDDVAAACMGRLPYAGALLHMAEISMRHQRERHTELASLAADGGNASDFGYRIRRLIDVTETTRIGLTRQSFFMGLALITMLMVSFVAWGQNPNPQDSQRNTSASPNTAATGTFQGRIMLTDVPPPLPKLRVPSPQSPLLSKVATDEEREAYEASLVEVADESMLVDEKQGLANVFVYLAKRPSAWQPTNDVLEPASLTFSNDRLEPRAAIVSTDQDLRVTNTGEMLDTFRFEPILNGPQNRLIMNGTEFQVERPFDKPERTPIVAKSDIHPWKKNYLLVVDHPFAAITDSQGRFSINGLPPGEHTFLVWHERVGWLEKSLVVNVQAGETTTVDRSYGLDQFGVLTFQTNTRNAPAGILWGEAVEGLRLGIRPSPLSKRSTPLRQGDHLEFEVWLKNETNEVVKIDRDPRDVYSPRLMEDGPLTSLAGQHGSALVYLPKCWSKHDLFFHPVTRRIAFNQRAIQHRSKNPKHREVALAWNHCSLSQVVTPFMHRSAT